MAVRTALAVVLVLAACNDPAARKTFYDAPTVDTPRDPSVDAYVFPDAAPPPFDAAPLQEMACGPADAGNPCPLPPSRCLDAYYLIYYTGGSCVNDKCTFDEQWTYCSWGCQSFSDPPYGAGCGSGFT